METNEIVANEEVIEVAEEIMKGGSAIGIIVGMGIVVIGLVVYKYVAVPVFTKIKGRFSKQKREQLLKLFDKEESEKTEE